MLRALAIGILAATIAAGQVAVPLPTSTTVDSSALPSTAIGAGPSWTRGAAYPYSADLNVALRIGSSNWYSWTTISTPVAKPAAGQTLTSSITSGGAYIAAQSANGNIKLLTIVQVGFSTVQATSTLAPQFSGAVGLPMRLWKSHWWFMPYTKILNAPAGSIVQPGCMLIYGFGGK